MNKYLLGVATLLMASVSIAGPTLGTGTPSGFTTFMTTPSPRFGVLVNFDDPTTVTDASGGSFALPSNWYSSVGVASITAVGGAYITPYSDQSGPDFLATGAADGTANITIDLNKAANIIGVGLADSDGVPITLIALGAGNTPLATEMVTLPTGYDPYNGYYYFTDTSADILGLQIVQSTVTSGSGLAIDDVQFAPEPLSFALVGFGVCLVGLYRLRKRA